MGGAALPKYLSIGQSAGHRAGWGPTSAHYGCSILSGVGTLLHRIVFFRSAAELGHLETTRTCRARVLSMSLLPLPADAALCNKTN